MIEITLLKYHYDKLIEAYPNFAETFNSVVKLPESVCGFQFYAISYDPDLPDLWGCIEEDKILLNLGFPYDIKWNNVMLSSSDYPNGEAYYRVTDKGEVNKKVFYGDSREKVSLSKIIEAHAHGAIRQLIEKEIKANYFMGWKEQISIIRSSLVE